LLREQYDAYALQDISSHAVEEAVSDESPSHVCEIKSRVSIVGTRAMSASVRHSPNCPFGNVLELPEMDNQTECNAK
jgi:hypothetical protein